MIRPRTRQTSSDVADHYDELDWVYRQIWGEHVHHGYWKRGNESAAQAVEALCDLVADKLDLAEGQALCDIGCGYGATAARLIERHGVHVTGVTLSAQQAAHAHAGPTILRRDWLDNGFADGCFDCAYAIESSEHMPDKQAFFAEAFRTLKPGGRLVVCAWLARSDPGRWESDHLLEPICREGRLPGMGTREDYEAMATRASLRLLSFEDLSRQVQRTWTICAKRLLARLVADPAYLRLLASRKTRNRNFALSVPRLILAYRTGAMRYGLFVMERPA